MEDEPSDFLELKTLAYALIFCGLLVLAIYGVGFLLLAE
jgi:hypothetical protein